MRDSHITRALKPIRDANRMDSLVEKFFSLFKECTCENYVRSDYLCYVIRVPVLDRNYLEVILNVPRVKSHLPGG
jgi:hypothetical protein